MTLASANPPAEALRRLIEHHGPGRTARAFLAALIAPARARRRTRADAAWLPDHLRRDIGLPPHRPDRPHWQLR